MRVLAFFLLASLAWGAIANDKKGSNTSCVAECAGTPPATTASVNATAGTVIIVAIWQCHDVACTVVPTSADLATLSDGTNTYVFDKFCANSAGSTGAWWLYHVQSAAGGTLTLTATFATTTGWYGTIAWSSWTGLKTSSVLDQTGCSATNATGTTITVTTSGTLAQSNELVLGAVYGAHNWSAGSGFTFLNNPNSGGGANLRDEYNVTGTSGSSVSATGTQSSAIYGGIVGTFLPPPVAGVGAAHHKVTSQ